MAHRSLKVGELAGQTGVTVRSLHYYDEIGLLSPSDHTPSGHRLYTASDVVRLQQIKSLQQLGFSLDEIRSCLNGSQCSPRQVIALHLERLRQRIELEQRLCSLLQAVDESLRAMETPSLEGLIQTIEVIQMMEKYYTPKQLEKLSERRQALGDEGMRKAQESWTTLLEEIRAAMARGADPASPTAQALYDRYRGLIEQFTGGDAGIEASLREMYRQEPDIAKPHGYSHDPKMMEYLGKIAEAKKR